MRKSSNLLFLFPLLLVSYELVLYLANDAYLPALPELAQSFKLTARYSEWTLAAFFMGNASLQLLLGPLSERYGRRTVLFSGSLSFIIGSLFCTFSPYFSLMLVGRFCQGLAVSCMSIAGYATVHELFDSKQAIKTLAWMNALTVLAPALGPLLGAVFLLYFSWQQLFFCLMLIALPMILVLFKVMPETANKNQPLSIKTTLSHYKQLFKNTVFLRELLTLDSLFAANISWIAAGSFIMQNYFHLSQRQYGLSQAMVFCFFLVGGKLIRRFIDNTELNQLKRLILSLCAIISLMAISLCYFFPQQPASILLPMMLVSLLSGMAFPLHHRLGIDAASEPMGARMAVFSFLMGSSAMLASVLVECIDLSRLLNFSLLLASLTSLPLLLQFLGKTPQRLTP